MSDSTKQVTYDTTGISGTNMGTAMRLLVEQQIKEHIVDTGFAKEGELIVVESESGTELEIKSTSDRSVKEIMQSAFPNEAINESLEKKFKQKYEPDLHKPTNRAERRRLKKGRR